jgi:hypothetical protein
MASSLSIMVRRPARSVEEGLWTETGSEEKKVRTVVPGQLGRRGVRTNRQRGDAARLALAASNR